MPKGLDKHRLLGSLLKTTGINRMGQRKAHLTPHQGLWIVSCEGTVTEGVTPKRRLLTNPTLFLSGCFGHTPPVANDSGAKNAQTP